MLVFFRGLRAVAGAAPSCLAPSEVVWGLRQRMRTLACPTHRCLPKTLASPVSSTVRSKNWAADQGGRVYRSARNAVRSRLTAIRCQPRSIRAQFPRVGRNRLIDGIAFDVSICSYAKMQLQSMPVAGSLTFEEIVPKSICTAHVASSVFYHCLGTCLTH